MRLRVKPRKRKDEGSGLAAIDRESMRELGVSSGEFVAIEEQDGRTVARVWPGRSEDSGRGIVRIDGQLRDAARTRVDGTVEVDEPDEAARQEIFEVHTRDRPLGDDMDLDAPAERTGGHVGADIEAVRREAAGTAVREYVRKRADDEPADVDEIELTAEHFESALESVDPEDGSFGGSDEPLLAGGGPT